MATISAEILEKYPHLIHRYAGFFMCGVAKQHCPTPRDGGGLVFSHNTPKGEAIIDQITGLIYTSCAECPYTRQK